MRWATWIRFGKEEVWSLLAYHHTTDCIFLMSWTGLAVSVGGLRKVSGYLARVSWPKENALGASAVKHSSRTNHRSALVMWCFVSNLPTQRNCCRQLQWEPQGLHHYHWLRVDSQVTPIRPIFLAACNWHRHWEFFTVIVCFTIICATLSLWSSLSCVIGTWKIRISLI